MFCGHDSFSEVHDQGTLGRRGNLKGNRPMMAALDEVGNEYKDIMSR
jgi:hypothetical protein